MGRSESEGDFAVESRSVVAAKVVVQSCYSVAGFGVRTRVLVVEVASMHLAGRFETVGALAVFAEKGQFVVAVIEVENFAGD